MVAALERVSEAGSGRSIRDRITAEQSLLVDAACDNIEVDVQCFGGTFLRLNIVKPARQRLSEVHHHGALVAGWHQLCAALGLLLMFK